MYAVLQNRFTWKLSSIALVAHSKSLGEPKWKTGEQTGYMSVETATGKSWHGC